jgi:hypothetical protein
MFGLRKSPEKTPEQLVAGMVETQQLALMERAMAS